MKEEDKPKVTPMEPGEFEFRKAFEETTIRNMKTIVEFSQDTRKLVRELQEEVKHLINALQSRETQLQQMQIQIAQLLQDKFNKGT